MGIQRKIFLGFVIIGFILFLSGLISIIQLVKIENSVKGILSDNIISIDIGRQLSEETERLAWEVTQTIIEQKDNHTNFNQVKFDELITAAGNNITAKGEQLAVDSLAIAYQSFRMSSFQLDSIFKQPNSNRIFWFNNLYKPSLIRFMRCIKTLRVVNHDAISENAKHLERNFYRMIMPPIIAIAVGLLLIMLFNYYIKLYFISPLLQITQGIKRHLDHRISYNVKIVTNDEIDDLNKEVKILISQAKKREQPTNLFT